MEKGYVAIPNEEYVVLLINDYRVHVVLDALKEAATGAYNDTAFFDSSALSDVVKLLFPETHKAIVARFKEGNK